MKSNPFSDGACAGTLKMERERALQFNKYYTRPEVAHECSALLSHHLGPDTIIIEPSAGGGAFLNGTERAIFAYDVAPEHPDVIARDFLNGELAAMFREIGDIAMLGNPPFGRRSSLALAFLNRALQVAHTVGFILPSAFERWGTQRKVSSGARLILSHKLPEDAFTLAGRSYRLSCVFQVWTRQNVGDDRRLCKPPPSSHQDFAIMECRPDAPATARHMLAPWDFAVRATGNHDYRKVYSPRGCDPRFHWMMFTARDERALSRLLTIDFADLSQSRGVIPGFARSDVVARYCVPTSRC